jgi:predicted dinucleotide-binding enzyme
MPNVAVLGTGAMGTAMARRLAVCGHAVTIGDVIPPSPQGL